MCFRLVVVCDCVLICRWFLFLVFLFTVVFVGGFCLESTFFVCWLLGGLPSSHALLCVLVGRCVAGVVSRRCLCGISRGTDGSLLLLLCRSEYVLVDLLDVASDLGWCRVSRGLLCSRLLDLSRSLLFDVVYLGRWSCVRGFDLSVGDEGALDFCPSRKDFDIRSCISASVYVLGRSYCLCWLLSLHVS